MNHSEELVKLIFGLKLKKIRQNSGLSLKEVSQKANLSISYLNEIENGKKYPNPKKIIGLAEAYKIPYDQLVTLKVTKDLMPIANYLNLEIVNEDLLSTFGIDKSDLLSILLRDPYRVSAFINAGIEIAKSYQLDKNHFYFLCLRAFQELNENYFEEIEDEVETFKSRYFGNQSTDFSSNLYQHILEKEFGYHMTTFSKIKCKDKTSLRSVFIPESMTLVCNDKLTESQKIFLFAKEIGFQVMQLKKRPFTTSWLDIDSFDHVINNFKASYFAQALHIDKKSFIKDLEVLFQSSRFKHKFFIQLMSKYNASPEMLFTRITNLLPKYFGVSELFFIRYSSKEPDKNLKAVSKEMHLVKPTSVLDYKQKEQDYRRSITKIVVRYLNEEVDDKYDFKIAAFVSQSPQGNEYLTISMLMPLPELNNANNSVTFGLVLSDALKKKINFISDAKFQSTEIQQYFDAKRIKSNNNVKQNEETEKQFFDKVRLQVLKSNLPES